MDDLQEAVVELFVCDSIFKGTIGDAVKYWEVGSRIFLCGGFSGIPPSGMISIHRMISQESSRASTYSSSTRYGDESNEACRATLTEGLAFTRRPGNRAPIVTYHRHEMCDLDEILILAQWARCDKGIRG